MSDLVKTLEDLIETHGSEAFVEAYRQLSKPIYCPVCTSCGEPGCCPPYYCEQVKCTYGPDAVRQYENAVKESGRFYDWLLKLGVREPCAVQEHDIEEAVREKIGGKTIPQIVGETLIKHACRRFIQEYRPRLTSAGVGLKDGEPAIHAYLLYKRDLERFQDVDEWEGYPVTWTFCGPMRMLSGRQS